MSIFGMVDEYIRRQAWIDIQNNPERRDKIRAAANDVVNASTDDDEYKAIVRLARTLP